MELSIRMKPKGFWAKSQRTLMIDTMWLSKMHGTWRRAVAQSHGPQINWPTTVLCPQQFAMASAPMRYRPETKQSGELLSFAACAAGASIGCQTVKAKNEYAI